MALKYPKEVGYGLVCDTKNQFQWYNLQQIDLRDACIIAEQIAIVFIDV